MQDLPDLVRVAKIDKIPNFPLRKSTLYFWKHEGKHPELFVKLGGALYVNMDRLRALIDDGGVEEVAP